MVGACNVFRLAAAAAVALFGFQSGAALATVISVLVGVDVMLSVVHIVRREHPRNSGFWSLLKPAKR